MTEFEHGKKMVISSSVILKMQEYSSSSTTIERLTGFILSFALIFATSLSQAQYKEISGNLDGVLFDIVEPQNWNRNLLIFNHGLIFEHLPPSTYLDQSREPFHSLLEDGWLLSASSYRRNGLIVGDAVEDVLRLLKHLREGFGCPRNIFFIGESMGGAVTLRLLEEHPGQFQGALVLGRGLLIDDPASPYSFTYRPEAPVLFLSNVSEIDQAREYVARAAERGVKLALWEVKREGHVNLNRAEFLAAAQALFQWAEGHEITFKRDATITPEEDPSTARFAEGGAYGSVRSIDPTFGNLFTSFVRNDWARLGIAMGQIFNLSINEEVYQASLVSTYSDVPRGDWLAFPAADGTYTIAINFDSAAHRSGVSEPSHPIFISKPQRPLDPHSHSEPISEESVIPLPPQLQPKSESKSKDL